MQMRILLKQYQWFMMFYFGETILVQMVSYLVRISFVLKLGKCNIYLNVCYFQDLIVSGKPPVSEDLFKKGAMFYKNEDINCIPMCKNPCIIFIKSLTIS